MFDVPGTGNESTCRAFPATLTLAPSADRMPTLAKERLAFFVGLVCEMFHNLPGDLLSRPVRARAMDSAQISAPIFLFVLLALAVPVGMLAAGWLLGPSRPGRVKAMPYESGMDPIHDTRRRFDVRFHLVAIAFLVFDVELLFLYPWAVRQPQSGRHRSVPSARRGGRSRWSTAAGWSSARRWSSSACWPLGFVYAWRKGVFQWR